MKSLMIFLGALLMLSLFHGTALAQPDYHASFRFWGGVYCRCVLTDNDTFVDPVFGVSQTKVSGSAFAFGGDIEYRPVKLLGLGLGLGYSNVPVEFSHQFGVGVQDDKIGMMPIFFAVNLHFVNTRSVDIYGGYLAAYIFYLDDAVFDVPGTGTFVVETNNEFTGKGFNVGADISVSDLWAVNLAFRFVNADADDTHLLPMDPTFITFGITRRF
jgi:hypothetical protein